MARGWESKAVEEQIGASEAEREARAKPALSAVEVERRMRREGLLLTRARLTAASASSRDDRYRALVARSLEHVEAELAALDEGE